MVMIARKEEEGNKGRTPGIGVTETMHLETR